MLTAGVDVTICVSRDVIKRGRESGLKGHAAVIAVSNGNIDSEGARR
ncbi:hypothetical protein [Shewanella sp. Choline-02u-19]|nr:hypothetical protein [Shewanella sp. Choline-02u-19]